MTDNGLNEALDFWFNEWSPTWMEDQAVFLDLKQGQVSGYLDIYNNVEKYEGKGRIIRLGYANNIFFFIKLTTT